MPETGYDISQEGPPAPWPDGVARAVRGVGERERFVLPAVALFHVAALISMIAIHASPLILGGTILLKVQPVDPRDFFRGDYVILSYDIGRISIGDIEGVPESVVCGFRRLKRKEWLEGRAVYVALEQEADGRHWRAAKASIHRPETGKYIRGRYSRRRSWRGTLRFGIEAYFVQEGTGRDLERARNARQLSAEVALTSRGRAALRKLHVEP